MLLLFDLDHTLVDSRRYCIDATLPGFDISLEHGGSLHVHVRPFALELLEYLVQVRFPFGFWTAGTQEYAHKILNGIFRLLQMEESWRDSVVAVYSRTHATPLFNGKYIKNLDLIRSSFSIEKVMLIDDDPIHTLLTENEKSVITVPPFQATHPDAFLETLHDSLRMYIYISDAASLSLGAPDAAIDEE